MPWTARPRSRQLAVGGAACVLVVSAACSSAAPGPEAPEAPEVPEVPEAPAVPEAEPEPVADTIEIDLGVRQAVSPTLGARFDPQELGECFIFYDGESGLGDYVPLSDLPTADGDLYRLDPEQHPVELEPESDTMTWLSLEGSEAIRGPDRDRARLGAIVALRVQHALELGADVYIQPAVDEETGTSSHTAVAVHDDQVAVLGNCSYVLTTEPLEAFAAAEGWTPRDAFLRLVDGRTSFGDLVDFYQDGPAG